MNIADYNKAEVLAALYNNSKAQGISFFNLPHRRSMTVMEAQELLDQSDYKYFDYIHGRVLKVNLSTDELDTWLYNRDNGAGAAERVIAGLSKVPSVTPVTTSSNNDDEDEDPVGYFPPMFNEDMIDNQVKDMPVQETFNGFEGGSFGGAGASASWDDNTASSTDASSESSNDSSNDDSSSNSSYDGSYDSSYDSSDSSCNDSSFSD